MQTHPLHFCWLQNVCNYLISRQTCSAKQWCESKNQNNPFFCVSPRDGHPLRVPSPWWLQEPSGSHCCRVLSLLQFERHHWRPPWISECPLQTDFGAKWCWHCAEWGHCCVLVPGLTGEEDWLEHKAAEPGVAVAQLRWQWTHPGVLCGGLPSDGNDGIGQEGERARRRSYICLMFSFDSCILKYFFFFQLQQSSRAELMRVLKVLDKALEPRTYLVGQIITLADMAVAAAVLLSFKYVRMWCSTLLSYRSFHFIAECLCLFEQYEKCNCSSQHFTALWISPI